MGDLVQCPQCGSRLIPHCTAKRCPWRKCPDVFNCRWYGRPDGSASAVSPPRASA